MTSSKPEFFYVLGALIGDGYTFNWKNAKSPHHRVGLDVRNESFARKYASKLSIVMNSKINACYYAGKNLWFVRINNKKLFRLVNELRRNPDSLLSLIKKNDNSQAVGINFVEGFFDAEGCVKVINDKARKIPKICLDFTSTEYRQLRVTNNLLKDHLDIKARYSNQSAYIWKDGSPRKKVYHLRIYKKDYVRRFFKEIKTIKLYKEKAYYLEQWLRHKQKVGRRAN